MGIRTNSMRKLLWLALTAGAAFTGAGANAADRLAVQLMWVTQAQFAGYYVAKDKGFYKDVNLDVTIKPGAPEISTEATLAGGSADVIVDWLALALVARERGTPLVNVSQVFQGSSYLLACLKASGVTSLTDLPGHSVGVWLFGREFIFLDWMAKINIPTGGGPQGVTMVLQQSGPDQLANRQTACVSALSYNEYWQLIEAGFRSEDLVVFKSSDADAATLEDGLYVSGDRLKDPAFVDKVARFLAASLRGWAWAIENRAEAVNIVLANDTIRTQTREHQQRMMDEVAKLISNSGNPLGYLNPTSYEHTLSLLLSRAPEGIIHKRPDNAWTHTVYQASKKYWDPAR
jgi:NitT/TauT family transport system substrate-binding protein